MADTLDLGSSAERREGSTPFIPTMWIKSSFSTIGDCIEVRGKQLSRMIRIRDDKNPDVVVETTAEDWQDFLHGVKAGEFDLDKLL